MWCLSVGVYISMYGPTSCLSELYRGTRLNVGSGFLYFFKEIESHEKAKNRSRLFEKPGQETRMTMWCIFYYN